MQDSISNHDESEFRDTRGRAFRVMHDRERGTTAIALNQELSQQEITARTYPAVAADFLTIMDYARERKLTLTSEPARALAFFLTTQGIGNLWFVPADREPGE